MRKSTPGIDRHSEAFTNAAAIMKGDAPNSKSLKDPSGPPAIHSIDVTPADNGGFTVEHTPKSAKKDDFGGDYSARKKNVFGDAASAHAHLGKLMGCPGCVGAGDGAGK